MKNTSQKTSSSPTLQEAMAHYTSGQPHIAEELYRKVLLEDPENVQSLHILGIITAEFGRYEESVALLDRAIRIRKNDPLLFFTLALTLQKMGKPDEALLKYKKAVALKPDYLEAHIGIGDVLKSQGRFDEAALKYKRVIGLKPDHAAAYYSLGQALNKQDKAEEAVAAYQKAIALNPALAEAYNNLGVIFFSRKDFEEAAEACRRAISLKPDYADAHNNLGSALQELGRFDDAIISFCRVLEIDPAYHQAHYNLGMALYETGQLDAAVESYRKAIEIKPDNVEAYSNLGNVLRNLGRIDDAIESCRRALEIDPVNAAVHSILGNAFLDRGRVDDAIASQRRALELNPGDVKAQANLGFALLMSGQLSEGWQKYEARWEGSMKIEKRPETTLPQWTGQNPDAGDRLLIFGEQGLGDKLQFARYIAMAAKRFPAGVSVAVTRPLRTLLRRSFPGVEILEGNPVDQSAWQWHCPLLSLPLAFGTVLENIPAQTPYLVPDPVRVVRWKSRIAALDLPAGTRKIGVVWKPGTAMKIAKLKALAFRQLAPLLEQPGCAWFSLQKEPDPDNTSGQLIDWSGEFRDFDDTAALMMNLDLIISVDTSVAHLAGALGLPIWLFNRHASDWRWMQNSEHSPWYPAMRIFRQETAGDWDGVIKRMTAALSEQPPQENMDVDKEIESCQRKILELVTVVQQGGGSDIANGGETARELAQLYVQMGNVFLAREQPNKAASCYETALQLNPHHWDARLHLLKTVKTLNKDAVAKLLVEGLVAENPGDARLLNQLGGLQHKVGEKEAALESYQKAYAANPEDGHVLYRMANVLRSMGEKKLAGEGYARAAKLAPLIKTRANKAVPDFLALMIFTPIVGNTPTDYLVKQVPYETNNFTFIPDAEYDIELLKRSGQVVANLTTEADQANAILPQIARLVDQLGMPVINHPLKVQRTTRESIAALLRDIPGCRLARVVRHKAGDPVSIDALQALVTFPLPVLARPTGTHGGEKFEKIGSLEALESFIRQEPEADHYLIEYIDYKSSDGYFRKYRFFFVDGDIMPYHLAIGSDWKVHHASTDMDKHQWMQDEEKAFLENPQAVFTPQNYQSLRAIQEAVDLEYFGIDCGLDQSGNIVVFEVNATMLVHDHNKQFPYKTPFVRKIKQAFENMLRKRVQRQVL